MLKDPSATFLGLALGIMIITVGIIGVQTYYNPNVVDPSEATYQIEPSGSGFLITTESEKKLDDDITVEFIQEGTDSQKTSLTPPHTGVPVYIEPATDIDNVQSVIVKNDGEQLKNYFVTKPLDSQLNVEEVGNFTVKPNQQIQISLERFINNTDIVESYSWDTGLQIIRNETFEQTYSKDGEYSSSLVIKDYQGRKYRTDFNVIVGAGNSETRNVELPNNNISVVANPGEQIVFQSSLADDSLREVDEYTWSFGDGVQSEGSQVLHKYTEEGFYNLGFTATYTNGDVEKHSTNVRIKEDKTHGLVITSRNGYSFELEVITDQNVPESTYQWTLGDGTTVNGRERVSHTYEEYGSYDVSVSYETESGATRQHNGSVQTEVLVEMGSEPYIVESVSGNHSEELLPKDEIGDKNPALQFQEDVRYRITDIPVPIRFESEDGITLLSQESKGRFEDNKSVNWQEFSNDTVEFTVTEELGGAIYTYVPINNQ